MIVILLTQEDQGAAVEGECGGAAHGKSLAPLVAGDRKGTEGGPEAAC